MAVLAWLLPVPAHAQWSGSVAAESDYRFRGESLGGGHPALHLSANYDGRQGRYAGASAVRSELPQHERYAQVLAYAGQAIPLGDGPASVDLGAAATGFIGDHGFDFVELYAGLVLAPGKLRLAIAPDYFGRHVRTAYLEANLQEALGGSVRLLAHAGLLMPLSHSAAADPGARRGRADLRLGVGWTLGSTELTLAWSAVTAGGPPPVSSPSRRRAWIAGAAWFF